jgi:hypothetical protein
MDKIKHFPKNKVVDYPVEQELFMRLLELVHEYDGEMSTAAAIGVMRLAQKEIEEFEE